MFFLTILSKMLYIIDMELKEILQELHSQIDNILSFYENSTNVSNRAIADEIEKYIKKHLCKIYNAQDTSTARSIEDVKLEINGITFYCDIKCHNINKFSMPNLISVDRLLKLYKEEFNEFIIIKINYDIVENKVNIINTELFEIESLNKNSYNIGNLGRGQIQLLSKFELSNDRKNFLNELREKYSSFLDTQIKKFEKLKRNLYEY